MANSTLRTHHEKIGEMIDAAERANPFVALTIAKRAAAESHKLIGMVIDAIEKQQAANDEEF